METLNNAYGILEAESGVLRNLLIRNFNQHRRTKLFSYMSELQDCVDSLLTRVISNTSSSCDSLLRFIQSSSPTKFHISKALICCRDLVNHFRLLFQCDHILCQASLLIKREIFNTNFLPMVSLWAAQISRISSAIISFIFFLEPQLKSLSTVLSNIAIIHLDFSVEINNHKMNLSYVLSSQFQKQINLMKAIYRPSSLNSNKTNNLKSLTNNKTSSDDVKSLKTIIDNDEDVGDAYIPSNLENENEINESQDGVKMVCTPKSAADKKNRISSLLSPSFSPSLSANKIPKTPVSALRTSQLTSSQSFVSGGKKRSVESSSGDSGRNKKNNGKALKLSESDEIDEIFGHL